MRYFTIAGCFIGLVLLFSGCSSEKERPEGADIQKNDDQLVGSNNPETTAVKPDQSGQIKNSDDVIDDAIVRYGVSLTENEKSEILEPIKKSFITHSNANDLKDLRAKIEAMFDLREAQLKKDPNFDSLLNERIGGDISQSEWEQTVASIPDMDALNDARNKLNQQFPSSAEEAISQAQGALFRQALVRKLREKMTSEITVSTMEVENFLSHLKANSHLHVLYFEEHRNPEAAALELKKDQYWNEWLEAQKE